MGVLGLMSNITPDAPPARVSEERVPSAAADKLFGILRAEVVEGNTFNSYLSIHK